MSKGEPGAAGEGDGDDNKTLSSWLKENNLSELEPTLVRLGVETLEDLMFAVEDGILDAETVASLKAAGLPKPT